MPKRRFILSHHRSPGDVVCLTALMRDIHVTYPGEFETDFNTTVTSAWDHNPYVTRLWNHHPKSVKVTHRDTVMLACGYRPGLQEQNQRTVHFVSYFHKDFERQTGIHVPLTRPHGDLYLSEAEKATPPVFGRYWLVLSGGKSDATVKVWHTKSFQQVVDEIGSMGLGVVQTGSADKGHWHPKLHGDHVVDLRGGNNFRDFLRQIYHADGVVCGVTAAMHIAAALHKPCVVIGGGREAWWWEAYVNENRGFGDQAGPVPVPHRYLHTIGLLDCCKHHGCWKNKVVKIDRDISLCLQPVYTPEMPVPRCMQLITPEHVMTAIKSYYTDGSLPPLTPVPTVAPTASPHPAAPAKAASCATPTHPQRTSTRASVVIPADVLKSGVPIVINPRASIKVADKQPAAAPGTPPPIADNIFDHPSVGGKFTVFVLCYGDFHDLHRRCLGAILATIPHSRMDLRVGSNELCQQSVDFIEDLVRQGLITKHYRHTENAYKYPVMREMFWDPEHPITTKWVIWFDDDSICDVELNWIRYAAQHIAQYHKGRDAHMLGAPFLWSPNTSQQQIFQSRPWHQGRPLRAKDGRSSPNGKHIRFAAGSFWLLTHEALVAANIPDLGTGLTHTGGDWQIGEQLYQAGYELQTFNQKKQFVRSSSVPRRGVTMPTIDVAKRQQPVVVDMPIPLTVPIPASTGSPPPIFRLPEWPAHV